MLAVKVLDVKKCMQQMLATDTFDFWRLAEAKITTKVGFVIDGHITSDYYSQEEKQEMGDGQEGCISYSEVRGLCFDMIKGKRTPKSFRFSFLCPRELIEQLIQKEGLTYHTSEIANLTMNMNYADGELLVTSSCTMRGFSLDKSMEHAWDAWVLEFFRGRQIAVEDLS